VDLHALSLGRAMLVVRGLIGFLTGVVASNNPGSTADRVILLLGVWTLLEGAALVRQAYPPSGTSRRAELQPALVALGGLGVLVGAVTVLAPGLSTSTLIWLVAVWFAARAVAEGIATATAPQSRSRLFLGLATLVDLGLVVVLVTNTSGGGSALVLFSGALASVWGGLHLALGVKAGNKTPEAVAGRLLAPR